MVMKHGLGIPYMGGKRKIAKEIVDYIQIHNPNAKYFYDLFGGGGAISLEAVQRKQFEKVTYNELNAGVFELMRKLKELKGKGCPPEFYNWIDRETLFKHKDDSSWFGGLVATCYSFGNNKEKGYLYGVDIVENKRLLHEVVVNRCEVSRLKFRDATGCEIDPDCLKMEGIEKRRLYIMDKIKKSIGRFDLNHLERISQLQNIERINSTERVQQLQINCASYENVLIDTPINETIIYLDPPYKNTAKYQEGLDHDKLLNWIKKSPYKIYVSSYEYNLPIVHEISHRCSLSATNNSKKTVERLFCNREETISNKLF